MSLYELMVFGNDLFKTKFYCLHEQWECPIAGSTSTCTNAREFMNDFLYCFCLFCISKKTIIVLSLLNFITVG
jgi:hypothetical protein